MTDYSQEMAQKKNTLYGGTKMSSNSILRFDTKITFVVGIVLPDEKEAFAMSLK